MIDCDKARELIPWYVNGTCPGMKDGRSPRTFRAVPPAGRSLQRPFGCDGNFVRRSSACLPPRRGRGRG